MGSGVGDLLEARENKGSANFNPLFLDMKLHK